jgi:hypothetical protein
MDGILRCSRYSFGPNRLHYCGPDANAELRAQIEAKDFNFGLVKILREFKTLYPYLKLIASANNIIDPFDSRVVEAYWLGNELLTKVGKKKLYDFLINDLEVKKKIKNSEWKWVEGKLNHGAMPHHSFQVLNFWMQKGGRNDQAAQEFSSLDECRINAGKILSVNGPEIIVETEPLIYVNGKIILGEPTKKTLTRQLEAEYDIEQLVPGQNISFHWSVPCEVITKEQSANLRKYTLQNIAFANQTI